MVITVAGGGSICTPDALRDSPFLSRVMRLNVSV